LCAWLALTVSLGVYVTVSVAHGQAFYPAGRLDFFDLRVYRGAGRLVLEGGPLYGAGIYRWAPFTYPPFAAIVFTPLSLIPLTVAEVLATALGVLAVVAILAGSLRIGEDGGSRQLLDGSAKAILVPAAAAAALWLEPITATLGYGQIDLLITLLIVSDLALPRHARGKGALIGIAAGLKLTR
jgi:alpha-1,2-mannosyltransferase